MRITDPNEKAPILNELPTRLLGQVALLTGRVTGDALADVGAHRHQFAVLATLVAFDSTSQINLCRRTDIDRSDMNAALVAMEKDGYVVRRPNPESRRENIVELTDLGRLRYEDLRDRVEAAQEQALAPLSMSDRARLTRLLVTLLEHHAIPDS
tara:strand:- start:9498 stop:9959 length:462 start_codon:yes stop_codon:yes gene_type:complete